MEKRGFCTIVTTDYLPYAYALYESLAKQGINFDFNILVVNSNRQSCTITQNSENIFYYYFEDLQENELANKIYHKYYETEMDCLRWSFKSIFVNFLLAKDYQKVIYVDSDIFFFNHCKFIFEELDKYDVILAPHWRCSDPERDAENFDKNFREGIYNGGFVAVSKGGKSAMEWWAKACEYKCTKQPEKGFYDDQKYLELLASKFSKIGVLSHRGCNLAEWNRIECARTLGSDNRVLINHHWDIIFIHFTGITIQRIILGEDPLLLNHLEEYIETLKKYNDIILDMKAMTKKIKADKALLKQQHNKENRRISQIIDLIKTKVRLRTRFSKFLEG